MNRHRSRARRGYTLVFFAMFLFGFMALAALVIDIGFARLAQRQMQTAVDAAALEGLRFRDRDGVPQDLVNEMVEAGVDPADAENPEYARRWLASRIVAWTFDDNLNPGDGDLIGFGAGPVIELGDPIPDAEDLNASQLILPLDTRFYKPKRSDEIFGLEPNMGDEVYGDMVAGEYDPDKDDEKDEDYALERADYTRQDFTSRKDFTTPGERDNAFLVRMRRTNNPGGLDREDEVSSHGAPIPYLFGRGAFFPAGSPNRADGYSPRHHGMTVRATAIADARPVLSVGLPNRDVDLLLTGLVANEAMSFSLVLTLNSNNWNELPPNEEVKATVTEEGWIEIKDEHGEEQTVGLFYELELIPEARRSLMPLVIGRSLPSPADPPDDEFFFGIQTLTGDIRPGYVPVYSKKSDDPASTDRVVGFVEVTAEVWTEVDTEGEKKKVRFTRWAPRIVPENASAAVCHPLRPDGNELTSNELKDILQLNDENKHEWILAPVSVR